MKKNIQVFQILFLLSFIAFTGCGKKNDPTLTKTDLLTSQEWRGDQVKVNGVDVSGRQEVISEIGHIKSVRMKFNKDGTYNATFTNNQGDQVETGTWTFNDDESSITFDLYGEVNVMRLTKKNLDIMDEIPFQGTLFDAEVRFVK